MSYYDDLGVTPDATPEQIRESFRALARLLHPDQQTEPALRQAAEGQMRRLNQGYGVLSEPDKRRRYDAERAEQNGRSTPIILHPLRPVRKAVPFGAIAWTAAALASCGTIYWLGTQGQAPGAREEAPWYAARPAESFAGAWVSSNADLKFEGNAARLRWPGGEMQMRLLSKDRMEVNWTASGRSSSAAPPNGTAVLTRRPDSPLELR